MAHPYFPVFGIGEGVHRVSIDRRRKAPGTFFWMLCIQLPGEPAKDSPLLKPKVRDTDTGTKERATTRRQKTGGMRKSKEMDLKGKEKRDKAE